MEHCNQLAGSWMADAGMKVTLDQAGNLRGLYGGHRPDAPRLLIGSHLDTVPNAGKYDGILGVMIGIALIESLDGNRLPFAIEVIGFSDEEGVRFGLPFIGSRAVVGELSAAHRLVLDTDGIPLAAALERFRNAHPEALDAGFHSGSRAYLEFHIEQGPVLHEAGESLAVVDAIAGQSRATVVFSGRAGHAGTTPMALRRDAMTAAAEWILAVEATALATPGLVASTGRITCEPGATNIIPGIVRCSLDLRSANDSLRQKAFQSVVSAAREIAARRKVELNYTLDVEQQTVALDASLTSLAAKSIGATQTRRMVSGAGHDAMVFAPHLPSAMIFLRSPGGISHHPDESVLVEDVTESIRAGRRFLENFAQWITTGEKPTCTT
jgi:allantoate deiminase